MAAHKQENFYISTAINYTNGLPHMGHAYEAIIADTAARYHRSAGRNVFFLTGTDEHGQKIADTAAVSGQTPIELCDYFCQKFKDLNALLKISNDHYIRTTDPAHKIQAQEFWKRSEEAGDIYLGTYTGWYSTREECFLTDLEAKLANYLDTQTGKPLTQLSEESYFFRLTKYLPRLIAHMETNPTFVQPESAYRSVKGRLANVDELRDLSISRCTFNWGIPVPIKKDAPSSSKPHVMYVWFDALSNYVTALDWLSESSRFESFWPCNVHLIGKDIAWFHAVIWPCMLMSIGLPLPRQIFCHGFVLAEDGRKMGKSLGNVIDPHNMLDKYGSEAFRYFLIRESAVGSDLAFSERRLIELSNADLANSLGNLVHRSTKLSQRFCGGLVCTNSRVSMEQFPFDLARLSRDTEAAYRNFDLHLALDLAVTATHSTNQWLAKQEPWKICGDDEHRSAIILTAIEAIYALAHFFQPVIPDSAQKIFDQFHVPMCTPLSALSSQFNNLALGTEISIGQVLFVPLSLVSEPVLPIQQASLQVGKIISAVIHPSSDRLYILLVDFGAYQRKIVAGLSASYALAGLAEKLVVVVTNLKTATIRGELSAGMLLCAEYQEDGITHLALLEPPGNSPLGALVEAAGVSSTPAEELTLSAFQKISFSVQNHQIFSSNRLLVVNSVPINTSAPDHARIK